jgi:hypothetical protein
VHIVFVIPPSLPVQPVIEQVCVKADSPKILLANLRLNLTQTESPVVQIISPNQIEKPPEPADDKKVESVAPPAPTAPTASTTGADTQAVPAKPAAAPPQTSADAGQG